MTEGLVPGEVVTGEDPVTINEGRETVDVRVANRGDRPVQVGSHFHFFEANAALAFDREVALGMRLNVPAGTAVRFEPGETQTVELVALGGKRRARGANGLVNGSVDGDPSEPLERLREAGFGDAGDGGGTRSDGAGTPSDEAGDRDDASAGGEDAG